MPPPSPMVPATAGRLRCRCSPARLRPLLLRRFLDAVVPIHHQVPPIELALRTLAGWLELTGVIHCHRASCRPRSPPRASARPSAQPRLLSDAAYLILDASGMAMSCNPGVAFLSPALYSSRASARLCCHGPSPHSLLTGGVGGGARSSSGPSPQTTRALPRRLGATAMGVR